MQETPAAGTGQTAKKAASGRTRLLGYGACALAGSLWGTGFYFGRIVLNEISVEWMVFFRFAFASLGVLPVLFFGPRPRPRFTAGEMRTVLICSALGVPIQFLLQFHGLARTTVSHASLMVGAMPVLLAAAATLFGGEKLNRLGWIALLGSTVGAALVTLGSSRTASAGEVPTLAGDLLVILSLIVALAWILMSKKLMRRHSPVIVSAYTILSGAGMLALWVVGPWLLRCVGLGNGSAEAPPLAHLSATAWTALAISGLLCTATTTLLWNWGIHHVPASRAGVFLNIEPVLGSFLGVELLGERLGPYAWFGGALIVGAAVALTTHPHEPEPELILE